MIDPTKYPHLAKMQEVQPKSQVVGQFLDWLGENGMFICTVIPGVRDDRFAPTMEGNEALMARHFEIDLKGAELERRSVLEELQK